MEHDAQGQSFQCPKAEGMDQKPVSRSKHPSFSNLIKSHILQPMADGSTPLFHRAWISKFGVAKRRP